MDRQETWLALEQKKRQKEGHKHTGRGRNLAERSKSAELGKLDLNRDSDGPKILLSGSEIDQYCNGMRFIQI